MLRVAAQVLAQIGILAGAVVAGISHQISDIETILPGVLSDVGVLGVCVVLFSGVSLIAVAVAEGREADRAERRHNEVYAQIARYFGSPARLQPVLSPVSATPPVEAELSLEEARQIAGLVEKLPVSERQRVVQYIRSLQIDDEDADWSASVGDVVGLASGAMIGTTALPLVHFLGALIAKLASKQSRRSDAPRRTLERVVLRLQPRPVRRGSFSNAFLRTIFVPFAAGKSSV